MNADILKQKTAERREAILTAAQWCFLNFGFAKTSFDDIAKRAGLSRTLLYRVFKDKADIFTAVFARWLTSRHPAALAAVAGNGAVKHRLIEVCRLLVMEPWSDMIGAPMAGEFFDVCERLDPIIEAKHRQVVRECVTTLLQDADAAEVFILALDGLLADQPTRDVLEQRVFILADRFLKSSDGQQ